MILADLCDGFQAHVAACDGPLIVLLEHQRADEADDGIVVGEDANDICASLDFFIQPFERIGGVELALMVLWKGHLSEHVVLGLPHELGKFIGRVGKGIDQLGPVRAPAKWLQGLFAFDR